MKTKGADIVCKQKTEYLTKIIARRFRAATSLALLVSLIASWSLGSVSASWTDQSSLEHPNLVQDKPLFGQLIVRKGDVVVNGHATKSGATVLSGSVIETSSGGDAIVELATLGRIELGSRTRVTLTFQPGLISLRSECGRTEIEVYRGQVDVKKPKVETIRPDQDEEYGDPVELTAPAGTDFRVECERRKLIVLIPLGLPSLLLLGLRSSGGDVLEAPPSGELPPVTPTTP